MSSFHPLNVAVIGSGLGGLCAAIALRRNGHHCILYDRSDFVNEIGAGIGIVSNGTRILEKIWGIDLTNVQPVAIQRLVIRDWKTGNIRGEAKTGDFKERFGSDYYGCVRVDLHEQLKEEATGPQGPGRPAILKTGWKCIGIDEDQGQATFENGESIVADLIIGADGVNSCARAAIGIKPLINKSSSCSFRCVVSADKLRGLNLGDFLQNNAIQMWGGMGIEKIVIGPARGGETLCVYAFFSAEKSNLQHEGWDIPASPQTLLDTFPDLDSNLRKVFECAEDIKQWRLISHGEYPYWQKGKVCLLGDAAHPMMPDQNQGFSQAVEDAGALGYIFSRQYSDIVGQDIRKGLEIYENIRKQRATSIQVASLKARSDVRERIGWQKPGDPPDKLTNEWLCDYDLAKHVEDELQRRYV